MSDYIDDRIEGNFVFLAVRATDGSGRRAGVDLPMDPDELDWQRCVGQVLRGRVPVR